MLSNTAYLVKFSRALVRELLHALTDRVHSRHLNFSRAIVQTQLALALIRQQR
jgi:hypothetical protein